jgi:hypothetical protein
MKVVLRRFLQFALVAAPAVVCLRWLSARAQGTEMSMAEIACRLPVPPNSSSSHFLFIRLTRSSVPVCPPVQGSTQMRRTFSCSPGFALDAT